MEHIKILLSFLWQFSLAWAFVAGLSFAVDGKIVFQQCHNAVTWSFLATLYLRSELNRRLLKQAFEIEKQTLELIRDGLKKD